MNRVQQYKQYLDRVYVAVELYETGSSIRTIAKRFEVSYGTVRTMLISAGVTLRPRGYHKK